MRDSHSYSPIFEYHDIFTKVRSLNSDVYDLGSERLPPLRLYSAYHLYEEGGDQGNRVDPELSPALP